MKDLTRANNTDSQAVVDYSLSKITLRDDPTVELERTTYDGAPMCIIPARKTNCLFEWAGIRNRDYFRLLEKCTGHGPATSFSTMFDMYNYASRVAKRGFYDSTETSKFLGELLMTAEVTRRGL